MKFAKFLEAESVPEWSRKYIQYKQLKKLIKRIPLDGELEDSVIVPIDHPAVVTSDPIVPQHTRIHVSPPVVPEADLAAVTPPMRAAVPRYQANRYQQSESDAGNGLMFAHVSRGPSPEPTMVTSVIQPDPNDAETASVQSLLVNQHANLSSRYDSEPASYGSGGGSSSIDGAGSGSGSGSGSGPGIRVGGIEEGLNRRHTLLRLFHEIIAPEAAADDGITTFTHPDEQLREAEHVPAPSVRTQPHGTAADDESIHPHFPSTCPSSPGHGARQRPLSVATSHGATTAVPQIPHAHQIAPQPSYSSQQPMRNPRKDFRFRRARILPSFPTHESFREALSKRHPAETVFFDACDRELAKVCSFFDSQEAADESRLVQIREQLDIYAHTLRAADEYFKRVSDGSRRDTFHTERNQDASNATGRIGNALRSIASKTGQMIGQYIPGIDPDSFQNQQSQQQQQQQSGHDGSHSLIAPRLLNKSRTTYARAIIRQVAEQDPEIVRNVNKLNVAKAKLRHAILELHRGLELIKNYKTLNYVGFVKIMKKYVKHTGWSRGAETFLRGVEQQHFVQSSRVDEMLAELEKLYVEHYEEEDSKAGGGGRGGGGGRVLDKLRVPDLRYRLYHRTLMRAGFYFGLAIPLILRGLYLATTEGTKTALPYLPELLQIYGGIFLANLFACAFALNLIGWTRARINYVFIFELDPRDHLDAHQFIEMPAFFMLLTCFIFCLHMTIGHDPTGFDTRHFPVLLIFLTAALLFLPVRVLHWTARRWLIVTTGRVIAAGYNRIEFRDFFLGDEFCSLAYTINAIHLLGCAHSNSWSELDQYCAVSRSFWNPAFLMIPQLWRFLQCLRRYADSGQAFPHLANAGKYSSSIVTVWLATTFRVHSAASGGGSVAGIMAVWITAATISSIYTTSWDLLMDWGFGETGGAHPLLRPELKFSWITGYYIAMVSDVILRFIWIVQLIPGVVLATVPVPRSSSSSTASTESAAATMMDIRQMDIVVRPLDTTATAATTAASGFIDARLLSFILALFEVYRRWQWNFFRLENEHVNNCGQFRATLDIPLPFAIHTVERHFAPGALGKTVTSTAGKHGAQPGDADYPNQTGPSSPREQHRKDSISGETTAGHATSVNQSSDEHDTPSDECDLAKQCDDIEDDDSQDDAGGGSSESEGELNRRGPLSGLRARRDLARRKAKQVRPVETLTPLQTQQLPRDVPIPRQRTSRDSNQIARDLIKRLSIASVGALGDVPPMLSQAQTRVLSSPVIAPSLRSRASTGFDGGATVPSAAMGSPHRQHRAVDNGEVSSTGHFDARAYPPVMPSNPYYGGRRAVTSAAISSPAVNTSSAGVGHPPTVHIVGMPTSVSSPGITASMSSDENEDQPLLHLR